MAKRPRRGWLLWSSLAALTLVAIVLTQTGFSLGSTKAPIPTGHAVQRGPLRITVLERGNLEAADSAVLKNEVEGRTTILWLIEEGTQVEKGELVCELDTSDLHERRVTQEISVQNREAAHVKAKQNHAIQESQNLSEISRADRELLFAEMDRTKYLQGDFPQQRQQSDEEILLAKEELQRATQDLEWSERLAEKGFLENTQLEADRLAQKRGEIQLAQKERALALLEEHEHPRRLQELDADVEETKRELDRVKLQAAAKIVDYEAEVRTSLAQLELEREKLAKLDAQLAKAKMYAPRSGMVVYFVESDRWGGGEPLQEGSEVRERQEIITIPSAGNMVAQASLHESVLESVRVGMPCLVTVDAVPEKSFPARVKFKALLPDQVSRWMNPDLRVYRAQVELLASDERLRPGMSCSVEIIVNELADTLFVPLQAVYLDLGKPVCFVSKPGGWDLRSIEPGANDGKWVVVTSGLSEGESVLLSPPGDASLRAEPDESETDWGEGGRPDFATPAESDGYPGQGARKPGGPSSATMGSGEKRGGGGRPSGRPSQ
jgi:HlyD family secretion protein